MQLTVNGFRLAYRTWGDPALPPLVLMHSTSFGGWMWDTIARSLDDERYIIATDQRGHGDSEATADGFELDQFADDLKGALDQLGLSGVPALGHSSGSTTLLLCEGLHPGTFSKLVLIEPIVPRGRDFVAGDNPFVEQARRRRPSFDSREAMIASFKGRKPFDTWTGEALELYAREGTRSDNGRVALKCEPENEARFYEAIGRLDVEKYLPAIECPVLLVRGEHSDPVRSDMFEQVRKSLDADVKVIARAGHFIPQEQPDTIVRLIREHLPA